MMTSNRNMDFTLKSSSEFASRSDNIFDNLLYLEKNHEKWISNNNILDSPENSEEVTTLPEATKRQPDTKRANKLKSVVIKPPAIVPNPDSEAVFKKPFLPRNRKRNVFPNFREQPKKWTKYSLEDVSLSSDATNAAVAFQFLNELSSRKGQVSEPNETGGKIVFKKPTLKDPKTIEKDGFQSKKEEQSESIEKEIKPSKEETKGKANIMLAHLQEE